MSLLHESIQNKKFDVRMLEKNLVRGVVSDAEAKAVIQSLPDDAENAAYASLEEIEKQGK